MRSRRLFPHQIQPLLHRLMIRPARRPQKRPEFGFTRSHILVPAVPFGDCQSRPRNHRGRRSQRFQALRRTLILLQQRHSRYVGSASRAGLQLQCAPGRFLRLQWLTQEQLCQPEIGMYGGAIGVDPERLPKGVRGLRVRPSVRRRDPRLFQASNQFGSAAKACWSRSAEAARFAMFRQGIGLAQQAPRGLHRFVSQA